MAKRSGSGSGGGKKPKRQRQPGSPPKLSDDKGVPKSEAQIKGELSEWFREEINAELFKRDLDGYLDRRNIRQALGVGDLKVYTEQFEEGMKNSATETKPQVDDKKQPLIYGKPRENRPKVKKISTEYVLRPDDKSKDKNKGKGGK